MAILAAQTPGVGVAAQDRVTEFAAVRPPADEAGLQNLEKDIAAEIDRLKREVDPLIQPPATQPSDVENSRAVAARELLENLKTYQSLLKEQIALRTQIRSLNEPQTTTQFTDELTKLTERIEGIRRGNRVPPDERVTDEDIAKAQQDLDAATTDLAARTDKHNERSKRLEDVGARKEAAAAEVQHTQAELLERIAEHDSLIAAAANEEEREIVNHTTRLHQIKASIALLRQERIDLETQKDVLLSGQATQRMPLLKELVSQLQRRVDRLKQIKTRTEADFVRDMVEYIKNNPDALKPYEQSYWRLRLDLNDARTDLRRMQEKAGIPGGLPEDEANDLVSQMQSEAIIWSQFMDSVHRRPGDQIRDRYNQIQRRIADWQMKADQLRRLYDATYDDRASIEQRADQLEEAIGAKYDEAVKLAAAAGPDAKITELSQVLVKGKKDFDEQIQSIKTGLSDLTQRLQTATKSVLAHIDLLYKFRGKLYFAHLLVREAPLWDYRLAGVLAEWNAGQAREARAKDVASIRTQFYAVRIGPWLVFGAILIVVVALCLVVRYRFLAKAAVLKERAGAKLQQEGRAVAPVSDRMHIQGMMFLAKISLVVGPLLAAWLWVKISPLDGRIAGIALLFLLLAGTAHHLIGTLFGQTKPRFRLLPCSNVVARYYRRWLRLLFWISVILVPAPAFLSVMDWTPNARAALWSAYKLIAMLIVLVFAARRKTILKIVGRSEGAGHGLLYALISAAYPLIYLMLVALFAAQLIGYSALTNYIIAGATASIGTVIGAALAYKYVKDRVSSYVATLRDETEEDAESEEADGEEAALEAAEGMDTGLLVRGLGFLLLVGIPIGSALLVLGYWGISTVELLSLLKIEIVAAGQDGRPAITIGNLLLAIAVVMGTWVCSRTLRSVLESKVYPNYRAVDKGVQVAISTLLHYVLILFGLYFALSTMNVPLGALTVVLGTVGLGLGLGLQPLFVNFLSGLMILFERHLKVGDLVEVDGAMGEVTDISIRATTIRTPDNINLVVPNGDFITRKVVNWTLRDTRLRGKLRVGVAYGSDPRLVERLLLQVAMDNPLVLADPPPRVCFMDFGDNSLDFELYAWFNNAPERWEFVTTARFRITELLNEHGIEIPFPQRTLSTIGNQPLRIEVETKGGKDAS